MAIDRVLETLLAIGDSDAPLGVAEVAERLSVPLSSAYRHVAVLKRHGLVSDTGQDGRISLGPAALRLGRRFDRQQMLLPLILPRMQALVDHTHESAALMMVVGHSVVCVEKVESPLALRCSFQRGGKSTIRAGASAKALLAFIPEMQLRAILSDLPADEAASLREQIALIRKQGYAVSEGEVDQGIWGVSAPIYSGPGGLEGCLTLMAPSSRVDARRQEMIELLRTTAAETTKQVSAAYANMTTHQQEN